MALFIARIPRDMGERELEERFKEYGKITRFSLKRGYGFVEYEDQRDAADALASVKGNFIIEWAKNNGKKVSASECFHCGRSGHWARECPEAPHHENGRGMSDYRNGHGRNIVNDRRGFNGNGRGRGDYRGGFNANGYNRSNIRDKDYRRDRSPQRYEYRFDRRDDRRYDIREDNDRRDGMNVDHGESDNNSHDNLMDRD